MSSCHLPSKTNLTISFKLKTTRHRERVLGRHISPGSNGTLTEPIGKGMPIQLIYNDPEPGEPILLFGATSNVMTRLSSTTVPEFSHPLAPPSMHLSHASLDEVITISLFTDKVTGYCQGLLLKYKNGLQECLGQCRLGSDKETTVISPTALHICHFEHGDMNYSVRVNASTASLSMETDELEWKTFQMTDHIVWWFSEDSNIISIESNDDQ